MVYFKFLEFLLGFGVQNTGGVGQRRRRLGGGQPLLKVSKVFQEFLPQTPRFLNPGSQRAVWSNVT